MRRQVICPKTNEVNNMSLDEEMITKEDIKRGYYLNTDDIQVYLYTIIAEPFEDGYFCLKWTSISSGNSDFVRDKHIQFGEVKQFGSRKQAYNHIKRLQKDCDVFGLTKVHIGYIAAM